MNERTELLTTGQKALTINLNAPVYGTFAEIGAGQEVAREFFHAGGASGTIAKSISAYDMVFSDAIYGKAPRYVYAHLYENRSIESIVGFDADTLDVFSRDLLKKIRDEDPAWEKMVPPHVAAAIKRRGLFGYEATAIPPSCRHSEVSQ